MRVQEYEKRDIVDLLMEDGVDLTPVMYGAEIKYYKGLCPLHDDSNPSFCVYPSTQKWVCWSCSPRADDCIAYFQQRHEWSFGKARDHCCTRIDDATILKRKVQAMADTQAETSSLARLCEILRNKAATRGFESALNDLAVVQRMAAAKVPTSDIVGAFIR